ncbi:MAG: hypothetical protein AAFX65_05630 [Cyanobacteria bacterium J06638_7]
MAIAGPALLPAPARAIVYNLVDVELSYSLFGAQTATISGSFEYTGGASPGTFALSSINVDYDPSNGFLDFPITSGFVVNNGASTYLVFRSVPGIPTPQDCVDATSPCLRLNVGDALTGTPFQQTAIDAGAGAAGVNSRFTIFGGLPLTTRPGFANVIRAVPAPFSALLLAPLVALAGYRRRLLSARRSSAAACGSSAGGWRRSAPVL